MIENYPQQKKRLAQQNYENRRVPSNTLVDFFLGGFIAKINNDIEMALERIDIFVDSTEFSGIYEIGLSTELISELNGISLTFSRKILPQEITGKTGVSYLAQGLGNSVALLQSFDETNQVRSFWYLDFITKRAMSILPQPQVLNFQTKVRHDTYDINGKPPFGYDPVLNQVYFPKEEISHNYLRNSPADIVTVMSAAPAHGIGHALAANRNYQYQGVYYQSQYENSVSFAQWWQRIRSRFLGDKFNRPGTIDERISMLAALKIIRKAHHNQVMLWRNHENMEILRIINDSLESQQV
ncbi:MAG: hypothetical protein ACOZAN_00050 [Patescibacteria group bacterium]